MVSKRYYVVSLCFNLHPDRFSGGVPLKGTFLPCEVIVRCVPGLSKFKPMNGHCFPLRRLLQSYSRKNFLTRLFIELVVGGSNLVLLDIFCSFSSNFQKNEVSNNSFRFQKCRA